MIDNPFTYFITFFVGALLGAMLALVIGADVLSSPKAHHRAAYDAHGNLTCEFCKALVEKGSKNGK